MENIDLTLDIVCKKSSILLSSLIKIMSDKPHYVEPVETKAIVNELIKQELVDTKKIFDNTMTIISPSFKAINILKLHRTYSEFLKTQQMANSAPNDLTTKVLRLLYNSERNKPIQINSVLKAESSGLNGDEIRKHLVAMMNNGFIKRHQSFIMLNKSHSLDSYDIFAIIDEKGIKFIEELKAKSLTKKTDKEIILGVLSQMDGEGQYSAMELFNNAGCSDDLRINHLLEIMVLNDLVERSNWNDYQILIKYQGRMLDSDSYDELFPKKGNAKSSSATKEDIEAMSKKIDEVIEWCKKNDMGNEILFEELEEMKNKGSVLDWKNWKQLLVGKLVAVSGEAGTDFAKETMKHVYDKLTNGESFLNSLNQ